MIPLYLKEWRQYQKLSQKKLASRARFSQAALSVMEGGKRDMTLSSLERVAGALGIEPSLLFRSPFEGLKLNRQEREVIARLIVEGQSPEDSLKKELVSELRSLISQKLRALKVPGAQSTHNTRWQVLRRYRDIKKKYGHEFVYDILGRVDKLLFQYL